MIFPENFVRGANLSPNDFVLDESSKQVLLSQEPGSPIGELQASVAELQDNPPAPTLVVNEDQFSVDETGELHFAPNPEMPLARFSVTGIANKVVVMDTSVVDVSQGAYFIAEFDDDTDLTISGTPATAGVMHQIWVERRGGALTFPSNVTWQFNNPAFQPTPGRDIFSLFTTDGGVTWVVTTMVSGLPFSAPLVQWLQFMFSHLEGASFNNNSNISFPSGAVGTWLGSHANLSRASDEGNFYAEMSVVDGVNAETHKYFGLMYEDAGGLLTGTVGNVRYDFDQSPASLPKIPFLFRSDGKLMTRSATPTFVDYGTAWGVGDIVGVTISNNLGVSVSFSVNGVDQGVAWSDVDNTFTPGTLTHNEPEGRLFPCVFVERLSTGTATVFSLAGLVHGPAPFTSLNRWDGGPAADIWTRQFFVTNDPDVTLATANQVSIGDIGASPTTPATGTHKALGMFTRSAADGTFDLLFNVITGNNDVSGELPLQALVGVQLATSGLNAVTKDVAFTVDLAGNKYNNNTQTMYLMGGQDYDSNNVGVRIAPNGADTDISFFTTNNQDFANFSVAFTVPGHPYFVPVVEFEKIGSSDFCVFQANLDRVQTAVGSQRWEWRYAGYLPPA